jgi:hypothetical protein
LKVGDGAQRLAGRGPARRLGGEEGPAEKESDHHQAGESIPHAIPFLARTNG